MIYLDNSATTKVCDAAVAAMTEVFMCDFGNPSSLHTLGIEAEAYMDDARYEIAGRLGCDAACITFTSGGTESNNLALFGAAEARKRYGSRIVTSAIEHSSVIEPVKELERRGYEVIWLRPGENGSVREEDIAAAVNEKTILISLMYVNNETGALQPVKAAVRAAENACKRLGMAKKPIVHCDAVQAFGKTDLNALSLGVDMMSISAHKIHGPKGAGALYIKKGVKIIPQIFGGGQERGLRSGTENVPAIAGFGAAAKDIGDIRSNYERVSDVRDHLLERLAALSNVKINSPQSALPYITNISLPGRKSETMVHYLASKGIFVSGGSACSKGKLSYVLEAQGLSGAIIDSSLRISLSKYTTKKDIDELVKAIDEMPLKVNKISL